MMFFFVRDSRGKYRYFSSEPSRPVDVKFSKAREAWELARRKLMLLPARVLRKEQAFEKALTLKGRPLRIHYATETGEDKIRSRFSLFLQKQRTLHIVILAGEAVVLPFTVLTAILPGPNIFFYALALLMFTQWIALKGIGRTRKLDLEFVPDAGLDGWERAVAAGDDSGRDELIRAIEKAHDVHGLKRILA